MKDVFGHEIGEPAPSLQELYAERDRLEATRPNVDVERLSAVRAEIEGRENEWETRELGA